MMPGSLRGATLPAAVLSLMLLGCDGDAVDVDPFSPEPCEAPASSVVSGAVQSIERADLKSAVLHAAHTLTASLPPEQRAALRSDLEPVFSQVSENNGVGICRALAAARAALARLPDAPATRPDRDAIHLILDMVAFELGR